MKVHVVRNPAIRPGGTWWSSLSPDEILVFVAAAGVSSEGAEALERAWGVFIAGGEWRFQCPGGLPISAHYTVRDDLPEHVVVDVVEERPGHYEVALSALDFAPESCAGIQRTVDDSIAAGWSYFPAPVVRVHGLEIRFADGAADHLVERE